VEDEGLVSLVLDRVVIVVDSDGSSSGINGDEQRPVLNLRSIVLFKRLPRCGPQLPASNWAVLAYRLNEGEAISCIHDHFVGLGVPLILVVQSFKVVDINPLLAANLDLYRNIQGIDEDALALLPVNLGLDE
jgi:hypothetical protein